MMNYHFNKNTDAILFLHGLESTINGEKPAWLRQKYNAIIPDIDYHNDAEAFLKVCKLIENDPSIKLIIGSSMGAFFGLALSYMYNIQYLGFNPPLDIGSSARSISTFDDVVLPILHDPPFDMTKRLIVCGSNDDIVDPSYTFQYSLMHEVAYSLIPDMGHRVPVEVLQSHLNLK